MSSTYSISDGCIDNVVLLSQFSWYQRLDLWPFLFLYSACLIMYLLLVEKIYALVITPIILLAHLGLFVTAQSSVRVTSKIGYKAAKSFTTASHVLVYAAKNAGKSVIVKLCKGNPEAVVKIGGREYEAASVNFEFQKITYNFDVKNQKFTQQDYLYSNSLINYLNYEGFSRLDDLIIAHRKWGNNEYDIPLPSFMDLYKEHLIAPFFIFQVLCLVLWSLDDYWYYSTLTLAMLMTFEGMLVKQRLRSLSMLRAMRRPPILVYVYRELKWSVITSDLLIPGDIISITSTRLSVPANSTNSIDRKSQKVVRSKGGVTVTHDRDETDDTQQDEINMPCDALILKGHCVVNEAMLTGESVPQLKETIRSNVELLKKQVSDSDIAGQDNDNNPLSSDSRRHMLYAGTTIMQHTENLSTENQSLKNTVTIPRSPDKGCLCIVMRTGYGSVQGGLMRKILFASERITENSKETFFFILILLCCAIMASFTVLKHSLYDENRNKYKLILHCIMIITSVVPPELPMELSVAVTNSLNTLSKAFVYCTEPFRIPYAGKVSILCFDKTGTLTQDKMILKGVVDGQEISASGVLEDSSNYINCGAGDELAKELDDIISPVTNVDDCDTCADGVLIAMASCHSLYYINKDKIVGDPMELEAFHHSGFSSNMNLSQSSTVDSIVHQGRHISVKIKQRFLFSSELKRMSVLIEVASVNTKEANSTHQIISTSYMVCCKGAPEIIENLLHHIPPRYRETYLYHMKLGRRVLALSYKLFNSKEEYFNTIHNRQDIENQLIFAGFLIFDSNLKSDTKSVIKELRSTENKIVMITGDSPYTSSDVGKRISLLTKDKPTIILDGTQISHSSNVSTPVTISNLVGWTILAKKEEELKKEIIFNNLNDFSTLSQTYNICVTGNAIEILEREFKDVDVLRHICQYINIYARVIPVQKENIIKAYNNNGLCTLMCGDGTNDVGALRVSNIGISIINNYELEKQLDNKYNKKKSNSKSSSTMSSRDRALRAITEIELQDSDPTLIKLGDASIASPFTARRTSIDVVLTVLRQGRCTLVTTIQIYKILALNCLVSAYIMSTLYLMGLKQGDTQMTAVGLVTAGLFFFVSQAKPLLQLSSQRPPASIFNKSVLISIIGQFITHLTSLYCTIQLCHYYNINLHNTNTTYYNVKNLPDSQFQPNLFNTTIFILSFCIQISNFIVNYRGYPYTENIWDNKLFWRSLQGIYMIIIIVISGFFEPLNDLLQLVLIPNDTTFYYMYLMILIFDLLFAYLSEKISQQFE